MDVRAARRCAVLTGLCGLLAAGVWQSYAAFLLGGVACVLSAAALAALDGLRKRPRVRR